MRKFLIIVLSVVSFGVYGQTNSFNLIGEWEVVDNSDTLVFTFEKDSILTIFNRTKNGHIGGRETIRKGKSVRLIYLIDSSRNPFRLDFVILENDTKIELSRTHGIFKVITDNIIKVDLGGSEIHQGIFGEHSIMMERKKAVGKN